MYMSKYMWCENADVAEPKHEEMNKAKQMKWNEKKERQSNRICWVNKS